jgi:hypothetical protein
LNQVRPPREQRPARRYLWSYGHERELGVDVGRGVVLVGFHVEASDGPLGHVVEATYVPGGSYIVVRTPVESLFVLPAGLIDRIDLYGQTIIVSRSSAEVCLAPTVDSSVAVEAHLDRIGDYYAG